MGRYAQARRRGSSAAPASALPAPPAPVASNTLLDVTVVPQGDPDPGGLIRTYYSADEGGPFGLADFGAWANPFETGVPYGGYYYFTEVGNDLVYSGESLPSNVLLIE